MQRVRERESECVWGEMKGEREKVNWWWWCRSSGKNSRCSVFVYKQTSIFIHSVSHSMFTRIHCYYSALWSPAYSTVHMLLWSTNTAFQGYSIHTLKLHFHFCTIRLCTHVGVRFSAISHIGDINVRMCANDPHVQRKPYSYETESTDNTS